MADNQNTPGSPDGEPVYLAVGFIRRPHGVRGELVMDLHTHFPERMTSGRKLLIGEEYKSLTIASVRPHQTGLLVRFKGIETPEDAGQYRNQWVYIKADEAPQLPEGQLYQHELLGFQVIDEADHLLGELVEILATGANDVYIVKDDMGRELLLPAIPSVILDINPDRQLIRVHLLEGL